MNRIHDPTIEEKKDKALRPEDLISDWYIPIEDYLSGYVYPGPTSIIDHPRLHAAAHKMLSLGVSEMKKGLVDFVVEHDGKKYRGHEIKAVDGSWITLRKMPTSIPPLGSLGLPQTMVDILLHEKLNRGGLVIIGGETGNGKSTTCAATVRDRMMKFGSFCLTLEDPPEMPLHGRHDKGRCIQTEVQNEDWAGAMRGAMRSYPGQSGSMLYVGETRDADAAAEVLRIALNGHLVLTTTHASDVAAGLKRILGLAAAKMPDSEVNSIMATVFRLAVHQELVAEKGEYGGLRRRLKAKFMFSPDEKSPVAQKIKRGAPEGFAQEIQMQEMLVQSKGSSALMESWK